jgi:hypothetical protein
MCDCDMPDENFDLSVYPVTRDKGQPFPDLQMEPVCWAYLTSKHKINLFIFIWWNQRCNPGNFEVLNPDKFWWQSTQQEKLHNISSMSSPTFRHIHPLLEIPDWAFSAHSVIFSMFLSVGLCDLWQRPNFDTSGCLVMRDRQIDLNCTVVSM